jgi:hypothetical protein
MSERPTGRVEHVRVEQVQRGARRLMREPGEAPDAEGGVVMRGDPTAEEGRLRPRQGDGQDGQRREHAGRLARE